MRLTLIAPHDHADYCYEFAEMASEGCEVTLFVPDRYISAYQPKTKPRLSVEFYHLPRQRQALRSAIAMVKLARRVKRSSPDLVHVLASNNIWFNVLYPALSPLPIITTVHDLEIHPGDKDSKHHPFFFSQHFIRRSRAIFVHGEGLRQTAPETLKVPDKRVFAFPHVPNRLYKTVAQDRGLSKSHGSPRVLFFGRIFEYKGLRYLLEAAPIIQTMVPDVKFVIAGRGDDIKDYASVDTDFSCFEVHNRFIPTNEAAKLFAEADVLVLPYIEASQSGVLMIAMTFGLPVIATDVGEISSTLRSTGMGLIVPPADPKSLANALVDVLKDPTLRHRLAANANKAMATTYSNQSLSARLLNIYEIVLQSERRQGPIESPLSPETRGNSLA